jgi:phosphohistidine phosphatase
MRTLYLLRHGAAEAGSPGGSDFDRSLAPEGRRASQRVGVHLARTSPAPTLVLCSSARRAVETLDAVLSGSPVDDVRRERDLYLAGSAGLLQWICEVDARHSALLVVGHSPGIGQLAHDLVRPSQGSDFELLQRGFPAAALAVLAFDVDRWSDIASGRGRLLEFTPPMRLAATR